WVAGGLFLGVTGAPSLYASLTNDAIQTSGGAQLGGLIVGGVFLLMGAPALFLSIRWFFRALRGGGGAPPRTITAEASPSGGGGFSRLSSGFDVNQAIKNLPRVSSGGGGGSGRHIHRLQRRGRLAPAGAL